MHLSLFTCHLTRTCLFCASQSLHLLRVHLIIYYFRVHVIFHMYSSLFPEFYLLLYFVICISVLSRSVGCVWQNQPGACSPNLKWFLNKTKTLLVKHSHIQWKLFFIFTKPMSTIKKYKNIIYPNRFRCLTASSVVQMDNQTTIYRLTANGRGIMLVLTSTGGEIITTLWLTHQYSKI